MLQYDTLEDRGRPEVMKETSLYADFCLGLFKMLAQFQTDGVTLLEPSEQLEAYNY